jgi:hypothetical protein
VVAAATDPTASSIAKLLVSAGVSIDLGGRTEPTAASHRRYRAYIFV